MSNKDQTKDKAQKDAGERAPQVGALLRASRLRVGEDLRDVADILCIRYLYLEAIEDCRYGDLPGNTYAVGFIRSYAEHLGLDGDEVVRRYRLEQTGQKSATDLAFPTPVPDSGVPKGAIVFVGVLIALLVYGGWYVTTTDESILSDLISPVPDHLKHLVTGDDAPKDSNAAGTATGDADKAATGVEEVVRETTAAAEQMANAAGEAAQRSAEAAAEAAATASDAVTKTVESAAETAESASAPVTGDAPVTTAAPMAETPPAPVANGSNVSSGATATATQTQSSATAPQTQTEAPAQTASESASAPSAPASEAPASTSAESTGSSASASSETPKPAPAETAGSSPDTVTTEKLPAPTEAPVTETAQTAATPPQTETQNQPQTESQSETPAPSAAPTTEREVTAEDLNTLVLRQATGGSGSSTEQSPAPPETAALNSGDTANTSGIVIRATSSSWVEIRDPANSTIVFTGLMSAGKTFNVPDKQGLILDTGNAGALDITVDGTEVPKIGGVGAVRKNVSLDPERLKAGTAASR